MTAKEKQDSFLASQAQWKVYGGYKEFTLW
jgi:hypothetical protein